MYLTADADFLCQSVSIRPMYCGQMSCISARMLSVFQLNFTRTPQVPSRASLLEEDKGEKHILRKGCRYDYSYLDSASSL